MGFSKLMRGRRTPSTDDTVQSSLSNEDRPSSRASIGKMFKQTLRAPRKESPPASAEAESKQNSNFKAYIQRRFKKRSDEVTVSKSDLKKTHLGKLETKDAQMDTHEQTSGASAMLKALNRRHTLSTAGPTSAPLAQNTDANKALMFTASAVHLPRSSPVAVVQSNESACEATKVSDPEDLTPQPEAATKHTRRRSSLSTSKALTAELEPELDVWGALAVKDEAPESIELRQELVQMADALQAECDALEAKKNEFQLKKNEFQRKKDEFRAGKEKFKAEIKKLQAEKDKLRVEKNEFRAEKNEFRVEKKEFQEKLLDNPKARLMASTLRAEAEQLKIELLVEKRELKADRKKLEQEQAALEKEREALKSGELAALRKERARIEREQAFLQERIHEYNDQRKNETSLAQQMTDMMAERGQLYDLKLELSRANRYAHEASKKIKQERERGDKAEAENARLEAANEKLQVDGEVEKAMLEGCIADLQVANAAAEYQEMNDFVADLVREQTFGYETGSSCSSVEQLGGYFETGSDFSGFSFEGSDY